MKTSSDLDRVRGLLGELGFEFAPQVLAELMERAVKDKLSMLHFLQLVACTERDSREERRVKASLRLSGIPIGKTLDTYDFAFQTMVNRSRVEFLGTCEFAKRKENVLLLGPPGVGKSHLAAALGVKAVQNGFSVAFMTADDLMEVLRKDDGGRRALRRRHMTAAVLVIDELGFQALDRRDAHLLFKVLSHRYERGSTLVTSNKSVRDWPSMLAGDEVLATAILDRLLHHCHVVQIDGRSFRMKDIDKRSSAP